MSMSTSVLPAPATTSRETAALGLLIVATLAALVSVPRASWATSPFDPCHLAVVGALAAVATLAVTARLGDRAVPVERGLSAIFLAAMPLVYVGSALLSPAHPAGAPWPWTELAAVPLYGALAALGLRRWPWLLPVGIALHGVGWDLWHYGRGACVPDWYAAGCLVLDVAMALYLGARLPRWRRAWNAER
jgi:hypothetical protein